MPRVYVLSLAVILAAAAVFGQSPSSNPIDVVYVLRDFNVLQAYDVDPKTGIPNAVGEQVVISENGSYVIPSPDDHFVYVLAWDKANNEQLRVFATDEQGVIHQPPIQAVKISNVDYFEIDPNRKFAYAVEETQDSQGEMVATIWEAPVDSEIGLIGNLSRVVGPSAPNGPCGTGWSVIGFVGFDGFNTDGSKLYYDWYCTTHDSISATYFNRDEHGHRNARRKNRSIQVGAGL